ncbi:hepatitis A virus cellular receptor 1 [Oryzias melastigma]|uniref:hepatitis A virus cellular receptor 1 n=1 Tax=Oryzias melastigma TaxID=30732 RepID=UPI000CF836E3|nr:hepatitis A virus cellular receptor 1 [Oryzias melastigma]
MKILVLLLALLPVSQCERRITGRRGLDITLPCNYDIKTNGPTEVCWGRGDLPFRGCSDQVLATDGHQVKEDTRVSSRYQLKGRLDEGDVSLTIMNITDEDTGLYGCRVQVPGLFNDLKDHVLLTVKAGSDCDDDGVIAYVGEEVTLPCRYNVTSGRIPMCWNRGALTTIGCVNTLLATDGSIVKEEKRVSSRYQLLGRLDEGDVSLTIKNVQEDDSGMYACRVEIPGLFNDEIRYVDLSVVKASTSTTGQTQQSSNANCRKGSRK